MFDAGCVKCCNMIKFLHTADVHLGSKFKYLGDRAPLYREQLKKVLVRIVELAVEEKVGIVLVAGDLFDSNNISASIIEFVKNQFKILQDNSIKVCLLAGTHDSLEPGSIYARENFTKEFDNVYVFLGQENFEFLDLDLTVWGKSNKHPQSSETPIIKLDGSNTRYNILMAHGSVQIEGKSAEDDYPIEFSQIKNCGMDYVAMGHWHSTGDYSQGDVKCYYSGSPEMLDIDQKGSGNILIGEIKDKNDIVINREKVGIINSVRSEIDLGLIENEESLKTAILKQVDVNTIKIVELNGFVLPSLVVNVQELERELGENFFRLKIVNNAHLKLESINERDYPEELVIGQFVRLIKQKIAENSDEAEKKKFEQALNLGLAELGGKNVL